MTDTRAGRRTCFPEEREERHDRRRRASLDPASAGNATGSVATHRGPVRSRAHRAGARLRARRRAARPAASGHMPACASSATSSRSRASSSSSASASSRCSRAGSRRTREDWQPPYDANYLNSAEPGAVARPSLRHRPAGPRLLQPRHLRHPDVAGRRDRGRAARDGHRHRHRRRRRLLRRRDRQRAHALHRPDPHGAGPRGPARRRCVPRLLGGRRAARRHVVQHPATDGDRSHPRLPVLDRDRAHRARPVPLVTREGVRGGGQGIRGRRPAHHRCGTSSPTASARSSSTRR